MPAFIANIVNIAATVVGVVQSALPALKEVVVALIRLIAILPIWFSTPEKPIEAVNRVYDKIYGIVEKVKNAILIIK